MATMALISNTKRHSVEALSCTFAGDARVS
jgi:hypothetical protein